MALKIKKIHPPGKHPHPKPRITEECTLVEVRYPKCAIPISEDDFDRFSAYVLADLRKRIPYLHRGERPGRLYDTDKTLALAVEKDKKAMAARGCELIGTDYKYCQLVPGGPIVWCKCDTYLCPDGTTYETCIQSSK